MMQEGMAGACPMQVSGTSAHAIDVDDGVALEFTTTGDVGELRRRVVTMASMHDRGCGEVGTDGGVAREQTTDCTMGTDRGLMGSSMMEQQDGGMAHGPMGTDRGMMRSSMMRMPPANVRAEDIAQGARLVFTPKDPKDLNALRQHTQRHAEHANGGMCPMMQMHGGSPATAAPAASARQ